MQTKKKLDEEHIMGYFNTEDPMDQDHLRLLPVCPSSPATRTLAKRPDVLQSVHRYTRTWFLDWSPTTGEDQPQHGTASLSIRNAGRFPHVHGVSWGLMGATEGRQLRVTVAPETRSSDEVCVGFGDQIPTL